MTDMVTFDTVAAVKDGGTPDELSKQIELDRLGRCEAKPATHR